MNTFDYVRTIIVTEQEDLGTICKNVLPYTRILLKKGVYRHKIRIETPFLLIEGEDPADTVIEWDDYAKKQDENGVELNTFRTYTVAVCADHVTLRDLTVRNSARNSPVKGQEVALTVYGDEFRAENCILVSEQDTLFCGPLPKDLIARYDGFLQDPLRRDIHSRQIYLNCTIYGTVDYIFGCGDCLFEQCRLVSSDDGRTGFVAAPAHAPDRDIGFVFHRCTFDGEGKNSRVFLARPWRDYGKASFIDCLYGPHIDKHGFDKWNDTERDKTARFAENVHYDGRVSWSKILPDDEGKRLLSYFD